MKSLLTLFVVIFCLVIVSGRNLHDNLGNEEYTEEDAPKHVRDPTASQMRHRRRSRQSYFDYNYHDYRRDHYNRQMDDSYNQIIKLLDEIVFNLRRPQQPTYVPVPIYIPQYIGCNNTPQKGNISNVPTDFFTRWPEMEDERQNFGLVPEETDTNADGVRPISFDPIPSQGATVRPPPVEHGSTQAGMNDKKTTVKQPGMCKAAVLTCCNFKNTQEQRSCFAKYNCREQYKNGLACRPEVVNKVLQDFAEAYAPITDF